MRKLIVDVLRYLPDAIYIILIYFKHFHRFPNLCHPKTFNEKLQWLKLHDRRPEYTMMVDKIKVKDYVAKLIGKKYIIPTLATYKHIDDIDIKKLPNQFVIKWNHDSGSVVICRDKNNFDWNKVKEKLKSGETRSGFWYGREWPYKNVVPMLLVEKLMQDSDEYELRDYKIFCFNGKPLLCQVISDRSIDEKIDFFDMDWKRLVGLVGLVGLSPNIHNSSYTISRPKSFDKMKSFASLLAKNTPFSRIDFYEINGQLYFGEITFYPASGFGKFYPDEWNYTLGNAIQLDNK